MKFCAGYLLEETSMRENSKIQKVYWTYLILSKGEREGSLSEIILDYSEVLRKVYQGHWTLVDPQSPRRDCSLSKTCSS